MALKKYTVVLVCGHDYKATESSILVKNYFNKVRPNTFWCSKCHKSLEVSVVY